MTSNLQNPIFTDETKAREWLEARVWPHGPVCPHCGVVGKATLMQGKSHRPGLYQCNACREPFTVTVGTLYERSKIPLYKWLAATHLLMASKKGMSALQISRMLGLPYKTAWFMMHRIRESLKPSPSDALGGANKVVEADESYVGGKAKNRAHREPAKKKAVVSLVERDGEVNHSANEYARAHFWHTNTVENYFSLLKRGIYGVYHHVSEAHLHRYTAEFDFRYNTRRISDRERLERAMPGIVGKRLTY